MMRVDDLVAAIAALQRGGPGKKAREIKVTEPLVGFA